MKASLFTSIVDFPTRLPSYFFRIKNFVTDFVMGGITTVASMEIWLQHTSPSGKILDAKQEHTTKEA